MGHITNPGLLFITARDGLDQIQKEVRPSSSGLTERLTNIHNGCLKVIIYYLECVTEIAWHVLINLQIEVPRLKVGLLWVSLNADKPAQSSLIIYTTIATSICPLQVYQNIPWSYSKLWQTILTWSYPRLQQTHLCHVTLQHEFNLPSINVLSHICFRHYFWPVDCAFIIH